jgi:hypothetical protein
MSFSQGNVLRDHVAAKTFMIAFWFTEQVKRGPAMTAHGSLASVNKKSVG